MEDGMEAISASIKEIIVEQLCLVPTDIQDSLTFDALGADSLDLIEIAMTVEDRFFIEISDAMLPNENTTTVGEFIAIAAKLMVPA
jgi:acyl carrier protein